MAVCLLWMLVKARSWLLWAEIMRVALSGEVSGVNTLLGESRLQLYVDTSTETLKLQVAYANGDLSPDESFLNSQQTSH